MSLSVEERKRKVKKIYSDLVVEKMELVRRAVACFTSRDFEQYSSMEP
jgi:cobalamin biosynthesis protein CobD/CbiB